MNCVFPLIKKAIEEGNITVDDIAKSVGEDVVIIKEKLCGKEDFIINEAMTINMELFPEMYALSDFLIMAFVMVSEAVT